MEDIRKSAAELVTLVKADTAVYKADNLTKNKCPVCGKPMLIINGKRGKTLVCSDRACGHRQPEKEREDSGGYKRSRREQGVDRSLIKKYSENMQAGNSFGALLKEALDKK
jgi:DNA topoisomerase-3